MSWIKKWKNLGLFINMACSMHMIRGVPVIILIGVVLSKVWERENFFDACSGVFDWEMLLIVLGSIFMVVQWLFHCIAGILAVLGIVGLEAAEEMYFGNQLFWKYAFPIDSTLYYTWTGFFVGMIWLMLLSFVLNSILFVVLQNKDFILKKLESGE